jgi:hypothetical protein
MDDKLLTLNVEIHRLSGDLLAKVDDSWNDIQQQTITIIYEATERLEVVAASIPDPDHDPWIHDLRSPGASMMSASALLMDELTGSPNEGYIPVVQRMQNKIIELRTVIDAMSDDNPDYVDMLTPPGEERER